MSDGGGFTILEVEWTPLTHDELRLRCSGGIRRNTARTSRAASRLSRERSASSKRRDNRKPAADLESGKNVPEYLWADIPEEHLGKPLIDPDPHYQDKNTYVVLDKNKLIYRFSTTDALCFLGPLSPFRRACTRILTHSVFNNLIMLTILTNCGFMIKEDPPQWVNDYVERVFLAIYTLEMIVKISSRGMVLANFTYLRDPWNILDISVILTAYLDIIIDTFGTFSGADNSDGQSNEKNNQIPGMAALRAFRVLRALKAISVIPGLKTIVSALIESVKALKDVMILTLFCLTVLALIGLQLFMGSLRRKCIKEWPGHVVQGTNMNYSEETSYLGPAPPMNCSLSKDCNNWPKFYVNGSTAGYPGYDEWVNNKCNYCHVNEKIWLCGNSSDAGQCERGFVCIEEGPNPDYGYTSFDSFWWAFLSLFRLMVQDYWENLYQLTLRANGRVYVIFFVLTIFLGSFYLINLILAVVAMAYEEQHQIVYEEETRQKELMEKRKAELSQLLEEVEKTEQCRSRKPSIHQGVHSGRSSQQSLPHRSSGESNRSNHGDIGSTTIGSTLISDDQAMIHSPKTNGNAKLKETGPMIGNARRPSIAKRALGIVKNSFNIKSEDEKKMTGVDCNGVVSLVASGRPEIVVTEPTSTQSTELIASNHTDVIQLPSLSMDFLAEPEIQSISNNRQRAKSQHSILSEQEDLEDQRCPPVFYVWTRRLLIWNCHPMWDKFQKVCNVVCEDPFLDLFITMCIVANTIFMALEKHPTTPEFRQLLSDANIVFTVIFAFEMGIKLIGLQPYYYFQNTWNIFDAFIVTMSLLEFLLVNVNGFSVLRTFRLMRVLKLAKSWPTLNMLMKIIINAMGALGNLILVLIIILFIFAVVGMQLFHEKYKEQIESAPHDQDRPRWHMADFWHSFLIVFRILCGEWIETMWDCMRYSSDKNGNHTTTFSMVCIPVFLSVQIIGNLVVLNLFLALLLSSFSADTMVYEDDASEPNSIQLTHIRLQKFFAWLKRKIKSYRPTLLQPGKEISSTTEHETSAAEPKPEQNGAISIAVDIIDSRADTFIRPIPDGSRHTSMTVPIRSPSEYLDDEDCEADDGSYRTTSDITDTETDESDVDEPPKKPPPETPAEDGSQKSLIDENDLQDPPDCWPDKLRLRIDCLNPKVESGVCKILYNARKTSYRIIEHSWFETFIILMIMASSCALAFEDIRLPDRPRLRRALKYSDKIFTYVFICEMFLKWLGYGFKKYFTNAWCWLDFSIVSVSLVSLTAELTGNGQMASIRSLRTLRALRPLRALSRFEGMKVVVNALVGAIPSIGNVLLVCLIFWLIFSIMGVNLFAGKFWKCIDTETGEKIEPSIKIHINGTDFHYENLTKTICNHLFQITNGRYRWVNGKITFDNALMGLLALLQVATFKGWMPIMYDAVDITDIDLQPRYEETMWNYVFFVIFIIFGAFFTLNLFIGVIIDNFNQQKKKFGGQDIFMTEEQRKYYNAMKKLGSKKPQKPVPRPENKLQAWTFEIVTHQTFEITIMILILSNMITMLVEHEDMSNNFESVLEFINYIFIAIFTGECALKMFALRLYYFKNPWNCFDFIVVILSIIGSTMSELIKQYFVQPTLFRIIRLARIGRILRLIRGAKGIRTLLFALMMSLPALLNIGLLLFLVIFIYSIFGMSQFAYVKRDGSLDDMYNFSTFGNAFLCLFMITTSAGWAGLLAPMLNTQPPDCEPSLNNKNPSGNGNCGNYPVAVGFFVSYLILTFLIVVNMYIAIILENFGVATEESADPLSEDDFEMFYEVWENYDDKATHYIKYKDLSDFCDSLEDPLRVPKPNRLPLISLDLPMVMEDRLHCLDVLFALTKRVLGDSEELDLLRVQMEDKFMASNPSKVQYEPITTTLRRKQEEVSATLIQRSWREYRLGRADTAAKPPEYSHAVLDNTDYSERYRKNSIEVENSGEIE